MSPWPYAPPLKRAEVLGLLQRIMPHQHLRVGLAEMLRELLGNVNRTMPASGATDGDGQIAPIRLQELAQALLEKGGQVRNHAAYTGEACEILNDGRVATVQIAQGRLPMGIRQAAHIEHEVRITRNA